MINGKRIAVVLPAYNAEKTLEATVHELPDLVDIRILVDDHSSDRTVEIAHQLNLQLFVHDQNYGYGRNQQTCYREALAAGADVIIMLHPDYQYTPLLVTAMASMVAHGVYDVVLGSRIIGGQALRGGMPFYKYVANRFLTAFENLFLGVKLSEYHTGYRAFNAKVLLDLPLLEKPWRTGNHVRICAAENGSGEVSHLQRKGPAPGARICYLLCSSRGRTGSVDAAPSPVIRFPIAADYQIEKLQQEPGDSSSPRCFRNPASWLSSRSGR